MRRFEVTDAFVRSKFGESDMGEDVFVDGAEFTVVCDGATDKSGLRFAGHSGGRVVAELVSTVVAEAPRDLPARELVAAINATYREQLGSALVDVPVEDHPEASFCAVEKRTGRIVRVGDVAWRTPERVVLGRRGAEATLAAARASMTRLLLLAGHSEDELRDADPGRQMILPALRAQAAARNRLGPDELATGSINGRLVPDALIEEWMLNQSELTVVLATDGYLQPPMTRESGEKELALDLAADPLRIGAYPATKGVHSGNESFDDRAFVRLDEVRK